MKKVKTILLIDDNEASNFLASCILKDFDASLEVTTAKNGQEALNLIQSKIPDLIFLDMNMPVMDGIQFLQQAKELVMNSNLVSLTTHLTTSEQEQLKDMGVAFFMDKPITREKLAALMS